MGESVLDLSGTPEQLLSADDGTVTYTAPLGDRDVKTLPIRPAEAREMWALGFQFSIYDDGNREYRLSIPYRTARTVGAQVDTVTYMQP